MSMADARRSYADRLEVAVNSEDGELVSKLQTWLVPTQNPGLPVRLRYQRPDAEGNIELGRDWQVEASDDLLFQLQRLYGKEQVRLVYP